jgi:hypothetical protein
MVRRVRRLDVALRRVVAPPSSYTGPVLQPWGGPFLVHVVDVAQLRINMSATMSWPTQLPPRHVALTRSFHAARSMAMSGGMVLLSADTLHGASLDGLRRLAAWLGVAPDGPWASDGARRHALVKAILRAQACIAKGPTSKRWDLFARPVG